MMLPNVWLWNMVDEFLYQFQSFAQYRSKLTTKSQEEIELLKKCDKVRRGVGYALSVCLWPHADNR
jgi:translation initiation factor 3 subunit L